MNKKEKTGILDQVREWKTYRLIRNWLKNTTLPGFYQVSLYDTIKLAWKESLHKDIFTRSYGVAYAVFISLFPFLIVIFSIISLFPEREVVSYVAKSIHGIMPLTAENFLLNTVQQIVITPRSGLLSVGFILALYFASTAMLTLMQGFDKNYEMTFKARSWLRERLLSISLTILIGILLIVAIGLIMTGDILIRLLVEQVGYPWLISISLFMIKWMVVVLSFLTVMGIIYRFGPAMKEKFKLFSPGAVLATIFCLLTSLAFSNYVNNFGTYNKVYGSISATIILLVWIQINCLIILYGYEINASIALNRDHRKRNKDTSFYDLHEEE